MFSLPSHRPGSTAPVVTPTLSPQAILDVLLAAGVRAKFSQDRRFLHIPEHQVHLAVYILGPRVRL